MIWERAMNILFPLQKLFPLGVCKAIEFIGGVSEELISYWISQGRMHI